MTLLYLSFLLLPLSLFPPASAGLAKEEFVFEGTLQELEGYASEKKEGGFWGNREIKNLTEKNYPAAGEKIEIRWSTPFLTFKEITTLQNQGGVLAPKTIRIPEEQSLPQNVKGTVLQSEAHRDSAGGWIITILRLDQNGDQKEDAEVKIFRGPKGEVKISEKPLLKNNPR